MSDCEVQSVACGMYGFILEGSGLASFSSRACKSSHAVACSVHCKVNLNALIW